jgi:hypothetical protein
MNPEIQQQDHIVEIEDNVMVNLSIRRYLKLIKDGYLQEQVISHNRVTAWEAMAIDKENEAITISNKMKKLEHKMDMLYELFHQHKESTTEAFYAKRPLTATGDSCEDPTIKTFNSKMRRITPTRLSRPELIPGYDIQEPKVYIHLSQYIRDEIGLYSRIPILQGDWICSYDGIMEYRATLEDKDAIGNATFYDPEAKVVCFGNKVISYGPNINQCPLGLKPNAQIYFDFNLGCMSVFACRSIRSHQEIYVDYGTKYWELKKAREENDSDQDITSGSDNISSSNNA